VPLLAAAGVLGAGAVLFVAVWWMKKGRAVR